MWKQFPSVGVIVWLLATNPASAQPPAKVTDPALASVPTDAFFFVSVKVSKLWDHPAAKTLRDWEGLQKIGPLDRVLGLRAGEIDRATLFAVTPIRGEARPIAIVTTRKPYDESAVLKALGVEKPSIRPKGGEHIRAYSIVGEFQWVVFVDETTLLYMPQDIEPQQLWPNFLARLIARQPNGPLAAALAAAEKHDITAALNIRALNRAVPEDGPGGERELMPFSPLLKATSATFTADFDKTAKLRCTLHFPDAEGVKFGIKGLQDAIKSHETRLSADRELRDHPIGKFVSAWGLKVLRGAKIERDGSDLYATADVPFADDLGKLVAALPRDFVTFTNESAALNNLKQIGIAMHAHHDAMGFCPGDVVKMGDKSLAWSWRVQILPFIEQGQLYAKLNMMKSWDDPANLRILQAAEMPKVFEIPGRPAPKGHTYFRILTLPRNAKGTDRPWLVEGERGPQMAQITDGTSNTFMVVEAGEAVPWYKPDLLAYDGKLPLPQLGDKKADRFFALLGDGSVKLLKPSKLGEKTLRVLITVNGGEVIELP